MDIIISIIIPHKNIPELLIRCLESIPQTEGVEVIVVDDDSSSQIVDFSHFPGTNRSDTTVVYDKSGMGAGRARNVGMEQARGKWLVFADADDFFEEGGVNLMMECQDAVEDIIYFNCRGVLSDDITKECLRGRQEHFNRYRQNHDQLPFRIDWQMPWGKMVRRELVKAYGIRFSEIKWSNDELFSVMTGCRAKAVKIVDKILYVNTLRKNSLAYDIIENKNPSKEHLQVRLSEAVKVQEYLRSMGMPDHKNYQDRTWLYFRHYPLHFLLYFVRLLFTDWHKVSLFLKIAYVKVKDRLA